MGSSFVAVVMFCVVITNQILPAGYLTFADEFMIITYFVLFVTFAINVFILVFQELKSTKIVEKFHKGTGYSIFVVVPLLYTLLFLFFFVNF